MFALSMCMLLSLWNLKVKLLLAQWSVFVKSEEEVIYAFKFLQMSESGRKTWLWLKVPKHRVKIEFYLLTISDTIKNWKKLKSFNFDSWTISEMRPLWGTILFCFTPKLFSLRRRMCERRQRDGPAGRRRTRTLRTAEKTDEHGVEEEVGFRRRPVWRQYQ